MKYSIYHYSESGLSNIYLINGFTFETINGEEHFCIDNMNGLHKAIAQAIVDSPKPLTHEEFRFLRIELNVSQKALGARFGVSEQTIAQYEKNKLLIPRTTDAVLRALYMESQQKSDPVSYFLNLLADTDEEEAIRTLHFKLKEDSKNWAVTTFHTDT